MLSDYEADQDAYRFALTGIMHVLLESKLVKLGDLQRYTLDALQNHSEMLSATQNLCQRGNNAFFK
jgi:hypothetical protein